MKNENVGDGVSLFFSLEDKFWNFKRGSSCCHYYCRGSQHLLPGRDHFRSVVIVLSTEIESVSWSLVGQSISLRFFGLEYAMVNLLITIVPPVSSFMMFSKPVVLSGCCDEQHCRYASLILRRGRPWGWYWRWKKIWLLESPARRLLVLLLLLCV